jgi:hypothetical protein
MDSNRIAILLERYWNCASTVEEEQELKAYFEQEEIADEFKEVASLFSYYNKQSNLKLADKGFDERILDKVSINREPKIRKLETNFQNYMKVAAVVVIVITGSLVFRMGIWQGEKPPLVMVEDTFTTPEEAYAETKKAFELIASKMNKGRTETNRIKVLSEAEDKIKNN